MKVKTIPAPICLQEDVECFRIAEYKGADEIAINVSLSGMPGIVFQHHQGYSPIQSIATRSGVNAFNGKAPTLFVYGQNTQRGVMHHEGPFTMTQVILKPHALRTLLGIHAAEMTNRLVELSEFASDELNLQLLDAVGEQQQIRVLTNFLLSQQDRVKARDCLVEEALRFIHANVRSVRVNQVLEHLSISESQFEKRFTQSVGVAPQFYLRVKRFNEAVRLLKSRKFTRLTDVAHDLNFYDQSHFIRDIKEFSGITPKSLAHKEEAVYSDQGGHFYLEEI